MCTEVLSRLLDSNNEVHGIKFGKAMLTITHILYADDLIIVGRANIRMARLRRGVLICSAADLGR